MIKINSGNGTLGRLIQDSTIAENINQKTRQIRQLAQDSAQQSELTQQTSAALMQQCETLVTILSEYRV